MSSSPHFGTGQTHLNSDAKIADEGRPQGAPLPIVFSRRYALGRAPTRGAPTNCLLSALCPGEGTHKGRPYQLPSLGVMAPQGGRAPTRGAPTDCLSLGVMAKGEGVMPWGGRYAHKGRPYRLSFLKGALWPGEGTHKGRPYRLSSLGVMAGGGHPQGAPLPIVFSRRYALGRAPTRGAPTDCLLSALCPGEGAHKGRPYRLSSLGVMPWGGRPQGAPLPIRRYALGRAPTRGAPTNCLLSALCPGEGTHKGRPYRLSSLGVMPWGGHPQGAPLPIAFSQALCPGEGTHKGRPYQLRLPSSLGRAPTRGAPTAFSQGAPLPIAFSRRPYRSSLGVMPWGGHPQGAPLPIAFSRRYALGRAPTRGAPTDCLLSALLSFSRRYGPWGGHPQGAPLPIVYRLSSLGVMPWGGHPQGAPLPIVFSRRYALGRAPTRGAPTNSPLPMPWGCPGEGTHKGRPYRFAMPWGGSPQGAPLPDSGSLTWVCPNLMQLPCILGCTRLRWAGRGHSSEVEEAVPRVTVGGCKMAQTFLSVYQ